MSSSEVGLHILGPLEFRTQCTAMDASPPGLNDVGRCSIFAPTRREGDCAQRNEILRIARATQLCAVGRSGTAQECSSVVLSPIPLTPKICQPPRLNTIVTNEDSKAFIRQCTQSKLAQLNSQPAILNLGKKKNS